MQEYRFLYSSSEPSEMTHHLKLLTAKHHQVLDIIETEKKQLDKQMVDAEPSEEPFIIAAQAQLKVSPLSYFQSFGWDYKPRSHFHDLVVSGTLNSKYHHHLFHIDRTWLISAKYLSCEKMLTWKKQSFISIGWNV